MKLALTIPALLLAACATPPPICDREAIEWTKYGTTLVPAECGGVRPIMRPVAVPVTHERDRPDRPAPDDPQDPVKPDEPVRPDPRPDTPDKPDEPDTPRGNPGNHKPVGNAGENPGKGGHEAGGGDRGMSDNPNRGKH